MLKVNIQEAKLRLSSLVDKAVSGEPFIITKNGHPLVVVTPYATKKSAPRIGFLKSKAKIPKDFNSMGSEEITSLFERKQ